MAIKRVTYNTLSYLVAEIKDRYAEKSAIGALGGLDKVAVENLADDLKKLINGKRKKPLQSAKRLQERTARRVKSWKRSLITRKQPLRIQKQS